MYLYYASWLYLGLKSKRAETSGEAEQWRSREANKQKSREAGKGRKAEKQKAEMQKSKEAGNKKRKIHKSPQKDPPIKIRGGFTASLMWHEPL